MALVEISDLVFEYPGKRALHNINLEIKEGSITALVGPNGAGKTTLMKCISALETPFSGQITVDQLNTQKNPRDCHKILGFLPDFFGLYDDLSVKQHLTYIALAREVEEDRISARIKQITNDLKLTPHLEKPAAELSRGLRQRLAIGMSIIHYPKLLLLDEPASGLDPEGRKDLSTLFKNLNAQGITLIVSSHILSELSDYSTDMLICKDGKIVSSEKIQTNEDQEKSKISLSCLTDLAACQTYLAEELAVEGIELTDGQLIFEYSANEEEISKLLKQLIEQGFSILSFTAYQANLQDLYLSQVADDQS